jgi:hypothetical protein
MHKPSCHSLVDQTCKQKYNNEKGGKPMRKNPKEPSGFPYLSHKLYAKKDGEYEVYSKNEYLGAHPNLAKIYHELWKKSPNDLPSILLDTKTDSLNQRVKSIFHRPSPYKNQAILIHEDVPLLMISIDKGDVKHLKLLLDSKADPNLSVQIQWKNGPAHSLETRAFHEYEYSALFKAVFYGNKEAAKILLQANANPNTGLHYKNYEKVPIQGTQKWVRDGMDSEQLRPDYSVRMIKEEEISPLRIAIERDMGKMCKLLIRHGADVTSLGEAHQNTLKSILQRTDANIYREEKRSSFGCFGGFGFNKTGRGIEI